MADDGGGEDEGPDRVAQSFRPQLFFHGMQTQESLRPNPTTAVPSSQHLELGDPDTVALPATLEAVDRIPKLPHQSAGG